MVIASLNGVAKKSGFSIQSLVDLTMKQELLAQVDQWYRSVHLLPPEERKQFLKYVQGIDFLQTRIYSDTFGLFVIENAGAFELLLTSDAFQSLNREHNVWIICLDPVDIVVIVRNEADRIYIEEESTYKVHEKDFANLSNSCCRYYGNKCAADNDHCVNIWSGR